MPTTLILSSPLSRIFRPSYGPKLILYIVGVTTSLINSWACNRFYTFGGSIDSFDKTKVLCKQADKQEPK